MGEDNAAVTSNGNHKSEVLNQSPDGIDNSFQKECFAKCCLNMRSTTREPSPEWEVSGRVEVKLGTGLLSEVLHELASFGVSYLTRKTPLQLSAIKSQQRSIFLMDNCGNAHLSFAAGNGHITIEKLLLEHSSADPTSKTIDSPV